MSELVKRYVQIAENLSYYIMEEALVDYWGVPLSDPQLGARGFIRQSRVDSNIVWSMDE
jgi:hypothetical protein